MQILSQSFPSCYEYNIEQSGKLTLRTRTTYFNEGQLWPIANTNIGYLSITKCLSSSFTEFLRLQNLITDQFLFSKDNQLDNVDKILVFLRDPCQRYMSGIAEYIHMQFASDIQTMSRQTLIHIVEALIGISDIDEHSIEQIHFFRDFNLQKFSVFLMNDKFSEQQVFDWMRDNGTIFRNDIPLTIPKINRTVDNEIKQKIYDAVQSVGMRRGFSIMSKCIGDTELINYFKSNGQVINV